MEGGRSDCDAASFAVKSDNVAFANITGRNLADGRTNTTQKIRIRGKRIPFLFSASLFSRLCITRRSNLEGQLT